MQENTRCQTWDENKCPSGIVNKPYNDTSRINKIEIEENVKKLDGKDVTIYRCPVAGDGELKGHELLITNQKVDVRNGEIVVSDQAGGIMHKIAIKLDKGTV